MRLFTAQNIRDLKLACHDTVMLADMLSRGPGKSGVDPERRDRAQRLFEIAERIEKINDLLSRGFSLNEIGKLL